MAHKQQTVFSKDEIRELELSNSICELDGYPLGWHLYVELDKLGHVVDCSEKSNDS
jgi:hypothetical protein